MSDLTFGTWNAAASPVTIEYSLVVIEEIRHEVAEGFQKLSRGGIEVGGLLFGVHEGQNVRVMAIRPVACEHAAGPAFRLSERDRDALQDQIRRSKDDARLDGLVCVGWYVSHTRTEIALTDYDQELFSSHFAEPWQVTLVIRPSRGGNMRAGFFVREPDGTVNAGQSYAEFSFPDRLAAAFDHRGRDYRPDNRPDNRGDHHRSGPYEPPVERERRVPERRSGVRIASVPNIPVSLPPRDVPQNPAVAPSGMTTLFGEPKTAPPAIQTGEPPDYDSPEAKKSSAKRWVLFGTALVVVAALAAGGTRYLTLGPASEAFSLSVLEREGQLDVEWNRAAAPVSKAVGGTLEIADGPQIRTIPLKPADLTLGKFSYKRETGDIQVRMIVEEADGKKVQEASRFLGPPPAQANSDELKALQKQRDDLNAEVNSLKQSNDQQAQRIQQLERTLKILQTRTAGN